MKRFLVLFGIFICSATFAHTINWHVDGNIYQTTTCSAGDSVTPPTAPSKYGYHFVEWAGYIPIEYLESTGRQYIDTGFKPNQNSGIIIDFYGNKGNLTIPAAVAQGCYFGVTQRCADSNTAVCFMNSSSWEDVVYISASAIYEAGVGRYIASIDKGNINIKASDGQVLTAKFNSTTCTTTGNIFLFANNSSAYGIEISPAMKIYSCKLYDNGVLVRDFIPVIDKNNVPCMFDKVSKQFFYNQGTGQFIAGPAI